LIAGESIQVAAKDLSVSEATLFRWKKQVLIDPDLRPGVKRFEIDELARANQTIKELESELELLKAASTLFDGEEPLRLKASTRLRKH
jgi:transposase-like protein